MSEPLGLHSVIGFGGQVDNGLIVHPDGKTLIYALGSTIVLRAKDDEKAQEFLQGHTDSVSCLKLSPSGRYLASGQLTYMGFTADVIIWDLETRSLLHRLQLQKVKIQALAFSPDERMLASLGGQDDNSLVLWDVATGEAICGSPNNTDFVLCCEFLHNNCERLVTAGNYNMTLWTYDRPNNKLLREEVHLGNMQRCVRSLVVDGGDDFLYCGTTSGDVLQVSVSRAMLRNTGPSKHPMQLGVTAITELPTGDLLVGGGDGSVAILSTAQVPNPVNAKLLKPMPLTGHIKLEGGITSLSLDVAGTVTRGCLVAYAGTKACNMYKLVVDLSSGKITEELVQTAHSDKINSLAFPAGFSELFATCANGGVRVWHLHGCRELLRIALPNLECRCVAFSPDGKSILTGWNDGKIRAFTPQSGKLLFTINDAHHKAVTAIAATADSSRIVSGGEEGMVRIWRMGKGAQTMEFSMKDHKGPINAIVIKASTNDECVSASSDGSCIIWDMALGRRRLSMFANTFFMSVAYHPDESQLVTTGTDRKITYWDAYDGQAIRIIDGSETGQVNCLAVDGDGEALVSGGADKLVRVWGYDEGHCYYVGVAHSGSITGLAVAPDKSRIVSAGSEGGIFVWQYSQPKALADLE